MFDIFLKIWQLTKGQYRLTILGIGLGVLITCGYWDVKHAWGHITANEILTQKHDSILKIQGKIIDSIRHQKCN